MQAKIQECFGNYIMKHDNFRMLTLLSASLIVKECERYNPDGELSTYPPKDTVLGFLSQHVCWSAHAFINALQSHVETVYAYQEAVIEANEHGQYFDVPQYNEALLINRALSEYQSWKEQLVKLEQEVHGKNWGSETEFNKAVWNKNNEKFIKLYR